MLRLGTDGLYVDDPHTEYLAPRFSGVLVPHLVTLSFVWDLRLYW